MVSSILYLPLEIWASRTRCRTWSFVRLCQACRESTARRCSSGWYVWTGRSQGVPSPTCRQLDHLALDHVRPHACGLSIAGSAAFGCVDFRQSLTRTFPPSVSMVKVSPSETARTFPSSLRHCLAQMDAVTAAMRDRISVSPGYRHILRMRAPISTFGPSLTGRAARCHKRPSRLLEQSEQLLGDEARSSTHVALYRPK